MTTPWLANGNAELAGEAKPPNPARRQIIGEEEPERVRALLGHVMASRRPVYVLRVVRVLDVVRAFGDVPLMGMARRVVHRRVVRGAVLDRSDVRRRVVPGALLGSTSTPARRPGLVVNTLLLGCGVVRLRVRPVGPTRVLRRMARRLRMLGWMGACLRCSLRMLGRMGACVPCRSLLPSTFLACHGASLSFASRAGALVRGFTKKRAS
jgi:hypothetical protein